MDEARCLLLDFFGTIVEYSPSWTEQGFHRTHGLVGGYGSTFSYDEFIHGWFTVISGFGELAAESHREYSIDEVASAFLQDGLGRSPLPDEIVAFTRTFIAELNTGVVYPKGIAELIASLAKTHRLALVSNTNDKNIVPEHLNAVGIIDYFDVVVLSVNIGWRKPHPEIFKTALNALNISANDAVFIGDSHGADYLGPREVGIPALLIDPYRHHDISESDRLNSIFDLAQ